MKKLIILISLSITLFGQFWSSYDSFAEYMHYETDYKTALTKAKKEDKPLFIVLVGEGCPFCHKLIDTILTKDYVREYINKKYIKLMLNDKDGDKIPAQLKRPFTPVTFIIDPFSEQIIDEVDGWMDEEHYLWHI